MKRPVFFTPSLEKYTLHSEYGLCKVEKIMVEGIHEDELEVSQLCSTRNGLVLMIPCDDEEQLCSFSCVLKGVIEQEDLDCILSLTYNMGKFDMSIDLIDIQKELRFWGIRRVCLEKNNQDVIDINYYIEDSMQNKNRKSDKVTDGKINRLA